MKTNNLIIKLIILLSIFVSSGWAGYIIEKGSDSSKIQANYRNIDNADKSESRANNMYSSGIYFYATKTKTYL